MHESEVSDPQRLHGLQPSRLLHPWDSPGKSTGVGCHCLLRMDCMVVLFLTFWGNSTLFPIVVEPSTTNSVGEFPFAHICASTWYVLPFGQQQFWQVCNYILSWLWFLFPWCLVMLSVFSCVCWPPIYLLWKISIQILCPLYNWVVFLFDVTLYVFIVYFRY